MNMPNTSVAQKDLKPGVVAIIVIAVILLLGVLGWYFTRPNTAGKVLPQNEGYIDPRTPPVPGGGVN